jgi:uncharacterized protein (DUF2336 family)
MVAERRDVPLEDPQARLERALVDEYLRRTSGCDMHTVHQLGAERARALLREAELYAAAKLAEVEARATYVHDIHGTSTPD